MEDLLREHGLLLDGRRPLVLDRRRAGLGDDARALAVAEFGRGARERRAARRGGVAQGLHPLDDLAELDADAADLLREAHVRTADGRARALRLRLVVGDVVAPERPARGRGAPELEGPRALAVGEEAADDVLRLAGAEPEVVVGHTCVDAVLRVALDLCGNQNFTTRSCRIVASTSTPSTQRLLDGAPDALVDFHTALDGRRRVDRVRLAAVDVDARAVGHAVRRRS